MRKDQPKPDVMRVIASTIVKYRFIIIALFLLAAIYCGMSIGKVQVNNDLTAFLSDETETRRGLTVMEEEFITYAAADVMVSNITSETAQALADEIAGFDHVSGVTFDETTVHYKNSSALLSVSFDNNGNDPGVVAAMDRIRETLSPYDVYISSEIGLDYNAMIAGEMGGILLLAAIVIFAVLLFTSRSYFEVVIFAIVFVFAALLNMGTNFWLGEISAITNTIAVIMQLALAIDYAIIFSHLYQDEAALEPNEREAAVRALAKAIVEISSSSLTTVSGLIALTLMQFGLGYDLGVVLSKGIICSLLTVFLLMPGLILLFPKALRRTAHRSLIPNMRPWGRFLVGSKYCFVWIFVLILPFAVFFSNCTEYAFSDSSVTDIVYSERRASAHKVTETFDDATPIAILVPSGDFDSEKAILAEVAALPDVKSAMGLANIEIEEGRTLTDRYTPRMFAELLDLDAELSTLIYQAYGVEHQEYQAIFGSADRYEVPLIEMFRYLFEKMDQGVVTLEGGQAEQIEPMRETLRQATDQLWGEHWDRMVLTSTVPVEGERSVQLVEDIRAVAERYYEPGSVLLVGDITSARDLAESYNSDSLLISLLTIAFVFLILLFTFRSVLGAAILVFVIQGSIWINFSIPFLLDMRASFVTDMIVSAIQMGATIDYAIVIMNRYQLRKSALPPKEAMTEAVNESFATVLTSGSIMTLAGFLIGLRISDVYVGHIGLAVGRGAFISVILVLTVLPQLIVLLDKAIDKTKIKFRLIRKEEAGE